MDKLSDILIGSAQEVAPRLLDSTLNRTLGNQTAEIKIVETEAL